ALAGAPGLQRDNFTPRRRPNQIFWYFFCNAEHQLAATHFGPDILWTYTGVDPKHHEIVDQIRAFHDHGFRLSVHGVDDDLDRLFGELLRHLRATRAQKPGCPRFRRVGTARRDHGVIKPGNRISHTRQNTRTTRETG